MKDRVNRPFEVELDHTTLRDILVEHFTKKYDEKQAAKLVYIDIAEVSIPPKGVIIKVRGEMSVIDDVPDKIFKSPTRS